MDNDDDIDEYDEMQGILRDLYPEFNEEDFFLNDSEKKSQIMRLKGFIGY